MPKNPVFSKLGIRCHDQKLKDGILRGGALFCAETLDSPHVQRKHQIDDFGAAAHFINVIYYISLDDNAGRRVATALIRSALRVDPFLPAINRNRGKRRRTSLGVQQGAGYRLGP